LIRGKVNGRQNTLQGRGVIAEEELSSETDKKYCTYVHVFRAWFSEEES
jgi:hypothetical protein